MLGTAWQQDLEGAAHITSTVKKQREMMLGLIFYRPRSHHREWCRPHSGQVFPVLLKLSRNTLLSTPGITGFHGDFQIPPSSRSRTTVTLAMLIVVLLREMIEVGATG